MRLIELLVHIGLVELLIHRRLIKLLVDHGLILHRLITKIRISCWRLTHVLVATIIILLLGLRLLLSWWRWCKILWLQRCLLWYHLRQENTKLSRDHKIIPYIGSHDIIRSRSECHRIRFNGSHNLVNIVILYLFYLPKMEYGRLCWYFLLTEGS